VIGHRQAPVGRIVVPEDEVAARLVVEAIADPREGADRLASRDDGQPRQMPISTTSSSIDGGMGSPCFRRLST
jgi:hypothetical protein